MGKLNDADANAIRGVGPVVWERILCHRPKAKKYLGAGSQKVIVHGFVNDLI